MHFILLEKFCTYIWKKKIFLGFLESQISLMGTRKKQNSFHPIQDIWKQYVWKEDDYSLGFLASQKFTHGHKKHTIINRICFFPRRLSFFAVFPINKVKVSPSRSFWYNLRYFHFFPSVRFIGRQLRFWRKKWHHFAYLTIMFPTMTKVGSSGVSSFT